MAKSTSNPSVRLLKLILPHTWQEFIIVLGLFLLMNIYRPLWLGVMFGFILGYYRLYVKKHMPPALWPLPIAMVKHSLISGILFSALGFYLNIRWEIERMGIPTSVNLFLNVVIFILFLRWRGDAHQRVKEATRHGSARFASKTELKPYRNQKKGLYVGGGKYHYPKPGHFISFAGTRGGKMICKLAPNLLGADHFQGSKIIVDVKSELLNITFSYQSSLSKTVQVLNPWNLFSIDGGCFNPLDLVTKSENPESTPDDCAVLAEMIVPYKAGKGDSHWDDKARSLIASLLCYITTLKPEQRTIIELWRLLRLSDEDLLDVLQKMAENEIPVFGHIIRASAFEFLTLIANSEKEWAGVLSTAQKHTSVFQSIPLQRSLATSSFDIGSLADGNTILYIVIPADKLQSHYRWLRLVITSALKTVIRNPGQPVAFLIDEAASLGYMPEIQTGMALFAGYNIYLWTIWQSLTQIQDLYGKNWETFIANSAVKHFFAVNDNTTAEYVSKLVGQTSSFGGKDINEARELYSTSRPLLSPDEVRRSNDILTFIDNLPVAKFKKVPYYSHPKWSKRAKPNPYYKD